MLILSNAILTAEKSINKIKHNTIIERAIAALIDVSCSELISGKLTVEETDLQ